ncbi:hypothetical protein [Actinoplanes aureus]|uniref:Uncharacterized protein n=1 Tax=Actinoplanes aureus TaxID=2792083 RepID=A0A931G5X3_9ACTN|nr:hypothetical protein [Actinoplanes aureus]MBG0569266.1 hypothetical protein [Actinoplanes aureus]
MSVDEVVASGGAVDDVGTASRPVKDKRTGASWSMDEAAEMVKHLRAGSSVKELAVLLAARLEGSRRAWRA